MKSNLLQLRLEADEKDAFQQAAQLSGLAVSAWVRERLRRAARIELQENGLQVPFVQALLKDGQ